MKLTGTDRGTDRQTDRRTDGQDYVLSQADAMTKKFNGRQTKIDQTKLIGTSGRHCSWSPFR